MVKIKKTDPVAKDGGVTMPTPIEDEKVVVEEWAPHVVSSGVKDEPQPAKKMTEVSAEDYFKEILPQNVMSPQALTNVVRDLVGKPLSEVSAVLNQLKNDGRIASIKITPVGIPLPMDIVPGRIQVVKDHADHVLDIILG